MEAIVRLFRLLASLRRIRVLRVLAVLGEMRAGDLAEATGCGAARLSAHLGLMAGAGLLWRRRSGRTVYYRLAERPGEPLVATVLGALAKLFAGITASDPKQVAQADRGGSPTDSDAALHECFTAFTHPRRLQMARYLAARGPGSVNELMAALHMSRRACLRHLGKLTRRGFVRRRGRGREATYALARGRGRVQRVVYQAVRKRLAAMTA